MLHVGALHQASEIETRPGWGGEVGGGLGGEVGVDERGEVWLVGEQRRSSGSRALPQQVALLLAQAVTSRGGAAGLGAQALGLCGAAVPAIPLLPAATAAAPSEPDGETLVSIKRF